MDTIRSASLPAARTASPAAVQAADRAVVLAGFAPPAVAELSARLSCAARVLAAASASGALDLLTAPGSAVLCIGPLIPGAAARDLAERSARLGSRRSTLVLAAGRLEIFDRLVQEDHLYYVCREPPPIEVLADLVACALRTGAQAVVAEASARARRRATEIVERVRHESDPEVAARLLAHVLPSYTGADRGVCWLYDRRSDCLRYGPAETGRERRESAAAGLVSFALRTGLGVRLERAGDDPRYDPGVDNPAGRAGDRFLAVPVPALGGGVLAVLGVARSRRQVLFDAGDEADLAHLARRLAPVLALLLDAADAGTAGAALFRAAALEHQGRGSAEPGQRLDLSPRWIRATWRLLAGWVTGKRLPKPGPERSSSGPARAGSSRSWRPVSISGALRAVSDSGIARLVERFPALSRLRLSVRRRRIPFVRQLAATDCGPACLTMVLAFFGRSLRLDEVRETVDPGRDGVSADRLVTAARRFGLRGRAVRLAEPGDLELLEPGAVLHWRFAHFVVFERTIPGGGAEILDPAAGRRRVSRQELGFSLTGVVLLFEPAEDFEPAARRPRGLRRYLRPIFEQRGVLCQVLALSVLLQFLLLGVPILTGLVVDRVVPRSDLGLLRLLALGLAGLLAFQFLSSLLRAHLLLHLRTRLDARMTLDFLEHLVDLPYAYFQKRSAGDLMMRLNSNSTVREILTSGALSGVLDGVMVVGYLALMLLTHMGMGLLAVGLGLLRVALFFVTRRRQRELMSESLQAAARARGYQVELFAGIEVLKSLGAEQRCVEHWSNLFVDELNVSLARGRLNALFDSLLGLLASGSPMVLLVFGGLQVLDGSLSLGTMLALSALAGGFLGPLSSLVSTGVQLQLLGSYLERIEDVLEAPKEQERENVLPAPRLSGGIEVSDVSFRYSPGAPLVVWDVSLEVEAGSFVAIVGPSGAGKTTLAQLLVGLHPPSSGSIRYDGIDLASIELRSLRRQIGIVHQRPFLFSGSVRSNLLLSDPSLPLRRAAEAAEQAGIDGEIAAMPLGYETPVGEGGAALSGGQRQRLALARALVHRPAVLLLDEATSSLDAAAERHIQDRLRLLRCTRIVIAHRLSTVVDADLILVIEQGRVVQRGRHDELLRCEGAYRRLFAAQARGQLPADGCALDGCGRDLTRAD